MKPFFSIIVPCCDVAEYIRECLDSVLSQPFADWECLLGVEDSNDDTLEIAREYEAKDARFKVFTGRRSGSCSASRNTAIELATGEYVIFLDGDDKIEEGSLQRLHDKIAERPGADLYPCVILVHNDITGKEEERRDNYPADFTEEMTGTAAILKAYSVKREPCPMLQMSVFRRMHLVANRLKCLHGRKRQDSEFTPRALYLAKRVIPLHEPFYIYRVRSSSISTLAKNYEYFHHDYAEILSSLLAFHAKVSREPGFDKRLSACWARHWLTWPCFFWFSSRAIAGSSRKERIESLQSVFCDGFADFDALAKYATPSRKLAFFFIKLAIRHPSSAWLTDAFFRLIYNPLTGV